MKIYLVGGAVRDKLLGLPVTEKDWVVVGASAEEMLAKGFRSVGKDFPVFLHPQTQEEYALARVERKVGKGYTGFTFDTSSDVTLEEDLQRRDLTINAMAESENGEIIDPYRGAQDIHEKILRHVSPAFSEDPVRILRVGRFAARYADLGFHTAPETITLMKKMVLAGEVDALVPERVWKELERALTEKNPEEFFYILEDCDALPVLFRQITSNGIKKLKKSAEISSDPLIRFACLLSDVPESEIKSLCERYRVPSEYRDLALLWARSHLEFNWIHGVLQNEIAFRGTTSAASRILSLLELLDAFRREERFAKILQIYDLLISPSTSPAIHSYFEAAKSIDTKKLIKAGYTGAELGKKIKEDRIEAIQKELDK